ncbi:MAG: hypothetical protein KDD44_13545 [Bdellovibrionales bacterium]|nr:hypothetical protein [Bdellovibrionales bacterium]
MRKLHLLAAAGLLVAPIAAQAAPLDELLADNGVVAADGEAARLHYKGGTRLEFPDAGFDMKLNLQIQSRYTYADNNDGDRVAAGLAPAGDTSGFSMRRVRLVFSGNMLNKKFSYKLQNDFVGAADAGATDGARSSDLRDAWLQWNGDDVHLRMGQYKVPFSRQENVSSANLQLVDRGIVNDFFSKGRNLGVMAHGEMSGLGYKASIHNGNSDGEGRNRPATDNKHEGAIQVYYNMGDYDRDLEGDYGNTDDMAMTIGAAATYGQGSTAGVDFDETNVNVDLGLNCAGFSLQGEYYFRNTDPDAGSSADDNGFYVQTGYFFVPQEWELAFRFGYLEPEKGTATFDDEQEYAFALNYYLDGHNLKLQNGFVIDTMNDVAGGNNDITDFRYELQLSGYF